MEKKKKDEEKGKKIKKKEKKEERGTKKAKRGNRRKGKNFKKVIKGYFSWHTNHIPRNKRKNVKAGHLQTSKKRHPHSKHFLPRACSFFFTLFT